MKSIKSELTTLFCDAFKKQELPPDLGCVVESQRSDLGQFQCNGALSAAKTAKKNPRNIAVDIITNVKKDSRIATLSIAGPGFINITLNDGYLAEYLNNIKNRERPGCFDGIVSRKVVIDFGGPNVAKPMHVGHLRSSIIGDCLQRLLRYKGYNVISDNHLGDWGTQMGMLINEVKKRYPDLPYFDPDFKGPFPDEPPVTIDDLEKIYPEASAVCKKDPDEMEAALKATRLLQQGRRGYKALWKHFVKISIEELEKDFKRLGVVFDKWLGESFYNKRMKTLVDKLKRNRIAVRSDGAVVIEVGRSNDRKEVPPLLLQKSDGSFLYTTSDLSALEYRISVLKADEIVYVVDKRQSLHFEQVFRAAAKAGIADSRVLLVHAGFGTVNGSDGKPFKTREGGVMRLTDLIDMVQKKAHERMLEAGIGKELPDSEKLEAACKVGMAALKFADLMNHRESDYIFDVDKFTRFEGKTGPYVLYTCVRIKSILKKAGKNNIKPGIILPPKKAAERELMLELSRLSDVLEEAGTLYLPSIICDFMYNLSQSFNRFYRDCHILRERNSEIQYSWLALISLALKELEILLDLTGIAVVERM